MYHLQGEPNAGILKVVNRLSLSIFLPADGTLVPKHVVDRVQYAYIINNVHLAGENLNKTSVYCILYSCNVFRHNVAIFRPII